MAEPYMPASKSDTHITPDEVWETIKHIGWWGHEVDSFFDPCPVDGKDGLIIPWKKWNYVNPPYGDGKKDKDGYTLLGRFVKKAMQEFNLEHYSIMLLPSKTDQNWFHDLKNEGFLEGEHIHWFDHRLKFKNNKWSATQPHFLMRIAP